jgi:EmrB/QacA subfamily drug resistance transporter
MGSFITDRRKQSLIVLSITFGAFMCTLDSYIVNISLPAIARDFNVTTSIVSRVLLIYLLFLTGTVLLYGKLGDLYGHARIFTWGFCLFTLSSLLCGLSRSIDFLIISRAIQGTSAAMLFSLAPALIPRYLPPESRGWGFGMITMAASLGLSIGPPVGGLISTHLSWHYIFLINVPVGIIAIFIARKVFPKESPHIPQGKRYRFDIAGTLLSIMWLSTLIYSLNMGQEHGWHSRRIIISLSLTVLFLGLFIFQEKRSADPLVDFSLLKMPSFTLANMANVFAFMMIAGNGFLMPFYLIQLRGLRADTAGLIMILQSLMSMVAAPWAGKMCSRLSPRRLCLVGSLSASAACLIFALTLGSNSLLPLICFLGWLGFSSGMFMSPNNTQIMNLAPEEHQGAASGILKTLSNLGAMMGVCLCESMYTMGFPKNPAGTGVHIAHPGISPEIMQAGFHHAYFFMAALGTCAFIASFFAKRETRQQ